MSKKKSKKGLNKNHQDNIKLFLTKIGIKNINDFGQSYWQEIRDEGVDIESVMTCSGPFGEQKNDIYFLTESIAKKTLSTDYKRIFSVIKSINKINGIPHKPRYICDLGGSTGIISMWLAKKHADSEVMVFDQCKNPLKIGEKWAKDMKISNINFFQSTYRNVPECVSDKKFDLIIATYPFEMEFGLPTNVFIESLKNINISDLSKDLVDPIKDFVNACKNIVEESGVIYINPGVSNELGLLVLFEFLRIHGLGIDWSHSTASPVKPLNGCGSGTCIYEVNLYIKPSLPSILKNAWEDLRAIMLIAQWNGNAQSLYGTDFDTYFDLLSSGDRILDITVESYSSIGKFFLFQKSGMAGLFEIKNPFTYRGIINSAAAVPEMVEELENGLNRNKAKIIDSYYHPNLKAIMNSFCGPTQINNLSREI